MQRQQNSEITLEQIARELAEGHNCLILLSNNWIEPDDLPMFERLRDDLDTPLAQRALLSSAQTARTATPNLPLTAITHVFTEVKSTLLAVDAAWNRLEPERVEK